MDMDGVWIITGSWFAEGILATFVFAGLVLGILRAMLTGPVVAALPGAIAGFRAAGGGSRHD